MRPKDRFLEPYICTYMGFSGIITSSRANRRPRFHRCCMCFVRSRICLVAWDLGNGVSPGRSRSSISARPEGGNSQSSKGDGGRGIVKRRNEENRKSVPAQGIRATSVRPGGVSLLVRYPSRSHAFAYRKRCRRQLVGSGRMGK